jgi:hypothetical protein
MLSWLSSLVWSEEEKEATNNSIESVNSIETAPEVSIEKSLSIDTNSSSEQLEHIVIINETNKSSEVSEGKQDSEQHSTVKFLTDEKDEEVIEETKEETKAEKIEKSIQTDSLDKQVGSICINGEEIAVGRGSTSLYNSYSCMAMGSGSTNESSSKILTNPLIIPPAPVFTRQFAESMEKSLDKPFIKNLKTFAPKPPLRWVQRNSKVGRYDSNFPRHDFFNFTFSSKPSEKVPEKLTETLEKTNPTKVVIVLDESGSMGTYRSQIINGVNSIIDSLNNTDCQFSLIKFSTKCTIVHDNKPIKNVPKFEINDYYPTGMTALYDAIGKAFEIHENDKKVVMLIITDGVENSSQSYSGNSGLNRIVKKIENYKNKSTFGWNILYLCNDQTLLHQSKMLRIGQYKGDGTQSHITKFEQLERFFKEKLNDGISRYMSGEAKYVAIS